MLAQADVNGYSFTDADFERVRSLIRRQAGISLADSKRTMVYSRLQRRLRETGHRSFTAYLDSLDKTDTAERQRFVNALTTNLTSFFRESYHFPVLADFLKQRAASSRPVRIWCAAASTGEEPYSLAMTAIEALGERPPVEILASDLDTDVLHQAGEGIYPASAAQAIGNERLRRFFMKGVGRNAGQAKVKPNLTALLRFMQINLNAPNWPFREPFDAIFCRNVMIYFDRETKQTLLERLHGALRPGGLLFVGHSENFTEARELFELQGKTVYRRVG
ncbi:MAG: CheR family methyltransferase [Burkholderiaceae bacterium]